MGGGSFVLQPSNNQITHFLPLLYSLNRFWVVFQDLTTPRFGFASIWLLVSYPATNPPRQLLMLGFVRVQKERKFCWLGENETFTRLDLEVVNITKELFSHWAVKGGPVARSAAKLWSPKFSELVSSAQRFTQMFWEGSSVDLVNIKHKDWENTLYCVIRRQ